MYFINEVVQDGKLALMLVGKGYLRIFSNINLSSTMINANYSRPGCCFIYIIFDHQT